MLEKHWHDSSNRKSRPSRHGLYRFGMDSIGGYLGELFMTCSTCAYRWCGSFTPHLNRAVWYCRKPHAAPVVMGKRGSDADLKEAKSCAKWKDGR